MQLALVRFDALDYGEYLDTAHVGSTTIGLRSG